MANALDPSQLAAELIRAAEECTPVEPFSTRYGPLDPALAAAVRLAWVDLKTAAGQRPVGKKLGTVRRGWEGHIQVLDVAWGHILNSTLLMDGTELPAANLIQPRVEAEFGLLLARDLAGPGLTAAHAIAALAGVFAAFEVIDSRFRPKAPTPEDSTADNGSHAYAVIGARLTPAMDLDLASLSVKLEINEEVKGSGTGAKIAGSPVHALVALANQQPLRAGEVVLTGSVSGAFTIRAGDRVRASFDRLGVVTLNVE